MNFVVDSFTGSDGDALDTTHVGEVNADWTIYSFINDGARAAISNANRLRDTGNTLGSTAYYASGTPPSAEYDTGVDIDTLASNSGSSLLGLMARASLSEATCYLFVHAFFGAEHWGFIRKVNGVDTTPSDTPNVPVTLAANSRYRMRMVVRNNAIRCYVNDVLIFNHQNPDIAGAGVVGIITFGGDAGDVVSNTVGPHFDNFVATPKGDMHVMLGEPMLGGQIF